MTTFLHKKFKIWLSAEFCGRYKDEGKEKIHIGLLADCGKVTLPYPLHPEYQVVCPSLPRTYLWLKEFYSSPRAKPNPSPQHNLESIAENENQNLKEDIKLLKESSPSQSSISKITEKKLATPELPIVSINQNLNLIKKNKIISLKSYKLGFW